MLLAASACRFSRFVDDIAQSMAAAEADRRLKLQGCRNCASCSTAAAKSHEKQLGTEYPAVSFHAQVEQIGQQFVWLPMNSEGHGNASGIELSDIIRIRSRVQVQGSIAYARAKFAGTDGILRPSNYDFLWIANLAGVGHLGRGYNASARYGYETGRPYTPFDLSESLAQNRPIYDLTMVNVPRAPYYSRLDAQINKEIAIRSTHLELYGDVDNILNRENFLSYAWMPRASDRSSSSIGTLWQTPIFPNFGVRMVAH